MQSKLDNIISLLLSRFLFSPCLNRRRWLSKCGTLHWLLDRYNTKTVSALTAQKNRRPIGVSVASISRHFAGSLLPFIAECNINNMISSSRRIPESADSVLSYIHRFDRLENK